MIKNIKLIIKKKYKTNKIYFNNEEYNDFYKEFKYINKRVINFSYIYKYLLELLRKYKFLLIFIIIIFI